MDGEESLAAEAVVSPEVVERLEAHDLEGKVARKGQATAYVCERRVCKSPTSDPEVFARQIQKLEPLSGGAP